MRKAQYSLLRNLRNPNESEATLFGKAIHKALEHWYCLPQEQRTLSSKESELADTLILDTATEYSGALESVRQFALVAKPLAWLGDADKRSLNNGIKILKAYFKHYQNDGLEVMLDADGKPYVEREISFELFRDDSLIIRYFGTIDMIVKNQITGQIMIADHKTTASLGSQFYNRIKPNHQYTGYVMAAQRALGMNTNLFLVNGIQVAKTKAEFARQVTDRNLEDFNDLEATVLFAVRNLLEAIQADNFPMFAPNPCTNYGSCQYLDICSSPAKLRETIIESKYQGVINEK